MPEVVLTSTTQPTPRPSPTPLPAAVEVAAQTVLADGLLRLEAVSSPVAGWVAVYGSTQLSAADLLGTVAVEEGRVENLQVALDAARLTEEIQVALHSRTADVLDPATADLLFATNLTVQLQVFEPVIEVDNQDLFEDGVVRFNRVTTPVDSWLGIYNRLADGREPLLGYIPVARGEHQAITMTMRWREALPQLTAVLYEDVGQPQLFDLEIDGVSGASVTADFQVTLPPEIVVFDQPIAEGRFLVERVISDGPGWLVVYQQSEDGQPGFIIGFAPLVDGLNEQIVVEVDETAVTDTLLLTLHDDLEPLGEFNFPAADPARRYRQQAFFWPLNTTLGDYLISRDQSIADETLVVERVVATRPVWVVVYTDEQGELGDIIGQTRLPLGMSQHITVSLTAEVPSQLYIALHEDFDQDGPFDPQTDPPLRRNQTILAVPIRLEEGDDTN